MKGLDHAVHRHRVVHLHHRVLPSVLGEGELTMNCETIHEYIEAASVRLAADLGCLITEAREIVTSAIRAEADALEREARDGKRSRIGYGH